MRVDSRHEGDPQTRRPRAPAAPARPRTIAGAVARRPGSRRPIRRRRAGSSRARRGCTRRRARGRRRACPRRTRRRTRTGRRPRRPRPGVEGAHHPLAIRCPSGIAAAARRRRARRSRAERTTSDARTGFRPPVRWRSAYTGRMSRPLGVFLFAAALACEAKPPDPAAAACTEKVAAMRALFAQGPGELASVPLPPDVTLPTASAGAPVEDGMPVSRTARVPKDSSSGSAHRPRRRSSAAAGRGGAPIGS